MAVTYVTRAGDGDTRVFGIAPPTHLYRQRLTFGHFKVGGWLLICIGATHASDCPDAQYQCPGVKSQRTDMCLAFVGREVASSFEDDGKAAIRGAPLRHTWSPTRKVGMHWVDHQCQKEEDRVHGL